MRLTPAHRQILSLKGEGNTSAEIAALRGSAKQTVENLLLDAKERLECSTRTQAVVLWWLLFSPDSTLVDISTFHAPGRSRKRNNNSKGVIAVVLELAVKRPYESGDQVGSAWHEWVHYMLTDMGVLDAGVDSKLQAAIKGWVNDYVENCGGPGSGLTMGELNCLAMAYWDGYDRAQVDARG